MASFLLFFFSCQRSLLLIPLLLAIISSKLFFLFLFHSEKIVFRKKKVLGKNFFFSLMNGLESSKWMRNYLFLDSTRWSKSKRENTQGLAKTFSSGHIPLACGTTAVPLLSLNVYWLASCAAGFSNFSTFWSCKGSSKVRFQKPLLVTRAPSARSFIQLPVCACLLNALFWVTIDCWNLYRTHNDSFDLQILGKNRGWSYPLSTTWKSVSPINTFSVMNY